VKKISKESDLLDSKKIDLPSVKHDSLLHPPISEKTSASIPTVKASGLSVEKMAPPAPEPATVYDKIYAVPLTGKNGSHEDLTFKTSPNVFNDREAPTAEKSDRLLDGKKSSSSAEHDAAAGASTYPCVELAPRFDYISKTPVLSYLDFQLAWRLDTKKYGVSEQVMDNKEVEGESKHIIEDVTLAVDDGREGFIHQLQYTEKFQGYKTEEFVSFNSNLNDPTATEQVLKIYHASPRKDGRYIPVSILNAMLNHLWPKANGSSPMPSYICVYHDIQGMNRDKELIQIWRYAVHKAVSMLGDVEQRYRPIGEVRPFENATQGFIVFAKSGAKADFYELERLMLTGKLPHVVVHRETRDDLQV